MSCRTPGDDEPDTGAPAPIACTEGDTVALDYRAGTEVSYHADGRVRFREYEDADDYEEFAHDLDLPALRAQYPDPGDLRGVLYDHFEANYNHAIEDPFVDGDALEGEALTFRLGSEEELERLARLILVTEPGIADWGDAEFGITCESEEEDAAIGEWSYRSPRIEQLFALALAEHVPCGASYDYNDGAEDRASGYNMSALAISYDLEGPARATPRERAKAARELADWLAARGHDPGEFALPTIRLVA